MRYEVDLAPNAPAAAGAADPNATKPSVIDVDVKELPSGALEVFVRGRRVEVDVVTIGQELSLCIDGQVVDLVTEGELPDLGAVAFGHRSYVRVVSDRLRAALLARGSGGGASEKVVKSPMPGRVVKIMVAEGDEVVAGQGLIIVEAMKMENELKAKAAGTVATVHVKALDTVENGAKLITLA